MKKKTSKHRQKNRKATPVENVDSQRRAALKLARNGVIGSAAVGGAGWWFFSAVNATAAERDLSRIGKGQATVVQIHDPTCSLCTQLQRNARKALNCEDTDGLIYLVADIRSDEGSEFARQHGLPHVTLVLLDGAGQVQNVLRGVRDHTDLKPHFAALVGVA